MILFSFLSPNAVTTTSFICLLSVASLMVKKSPDAITCWSCEPIKLMVSFSPLGADNSNAPSPLELTPFFEFFRVMLALSIGLPVAASVTLPLTVIFCAFKKWGRHIIVNANNSLDSFSVVCFINIFFYERKPPTSMLLNY